MITVIDCGSSKVPDIVKMLDANGAIVKTQKISEFKLNGSKGVVISGAPILLTEKDPTEFLNATSFLKNCTIPVLGICFGHQIIGMHYGSNIKRCNEDRDWQIIKFFGESEITDGFEEDMKFKEDHCECISLPNDFDLIASSVTCEVEMMKHKTKKIFGVQFHPEVSAANGENLMRQFVQLCNKE